MKKQLLAVGVSASVLMVGASAYANSVLDVNILNMVKNSAALMSQHFQEETDHELTLADTHFEEELSLFVERETAETIERMSGKKESEMDTAQAELESYFESLKKEVETTFDAEVEAYEGIVDDKMEAELQKIKDNMAKKMEKQLEAKLKAAGIK